MRALALALILAACGAPPPAETPARAGATTGAPMPAPAMLDSAGEAEGAAMPVLGDVVGATQLEPQLLSPVVLTPRPAQPARVRVALLSMPPGASWAPPAGACQDALLLVREGELRAVGAGIAPPSAPATLYAGDAVRFGPDRDGLVQNVSERMARTIVALVRAEGEPSLTDPGGDCEATERVDPLVVPMRSASVRSTPALAVYEGALRARILLDEDGAGAQHGSLTVLEGDADLTIPEHRHEDAAEVLFIEEGEGVMRIGDREVAVRPGLALYVPPGVLHDVRVDGARPLRAIQVHTPSGPEQRLRAR